MCGFMTGCDNSLNEPIVRPSGQDEIALVMAPEVMAYSGSSSTDNIFATYSANVNANQWSENWDCVPNVDLSDEQLEELKELLSPRQYVTNTQVLPFENYWVQQVYKGEDRYYAYDNLGEQTQSDFLGSGQMDHLQAYGKYGYEHINNFNRGDNTNSAYDPGFDGNHIGTTLMTDMPTTGIDPNEQFRFWDSFGSDYYFNYIIVQYNGEWYVGFDFEGHKQTDTKNPGEAMQIERDWCFTDWIVKITPAYHKGETPEQEPEQPIVPEEPADQPEYVMDEVEVNLSVEEHKGYLSSHLSIHVRSVTDVEVFIPMKMKYYCDVDDLAIVQKHEGLLMLHAGPRTMEYEVIPGHVITLNLEFEESGIRVWTDGVDEETVLYLKKTYNDGLTFEIWTYVNDIDLKPILLEDLNESTVRFLDKEPEHYINAFNKTEDGEKFGDDCTVSIVDEQSGDYTYKGPGLHYNGSPYNEWYDKN